jgi:hypothetical protein
MLAELRVSLSSFHDDDYDDDKAGCACSLYCPMFKIPNQHSNSLNRRKMFACRYLNRPVSMLPFLIRKIMRSTLNCNGYILLPPKLCN